MWSIEYRRGFSTGATEVCERLSIDDALALARRSIHCRLADNIRVTNFAGKEVGVFPVRGASSDHRGAQWPLERR